VDTTTTAATATTTNLQLKDSERQTASDIKIDKSDETTSTEANDDKSDYKVDTTSSGHDNNSGNGSDYKPSTEGQRATNRSERHQDRQERLQLHNRRPKWW
jgi:hypothetical protein